MRLMAGPALESRLAALETALRAGSAASAFEVFQTLVVPAPADGRDGIEAVLLVSRAAALAGSATAAIAALREAVQRAPDRPEPRFLLCALLLGRGVPEAGTLLGACLARFPEPSAGWVEIGDVLLDKGQKAAALICLGRGMPEAGLSIRCGLLARDLGRRAEARDAFAEAARRDPASPRALFLLGTAAQDLRDYPAAAAAYRAVLRLDPERAEAAVNLGTVLQETGDLAGAKAAYARAVRSRPESFARVAQALPSAPKGELWLDLGALRRSLAG